MVLIPHTTFRVTYDGPEFDLENPDHAVYSEYIELLHAMTGKVEDREGTGRRFCWNSETNKLEEYFS